MSRFSVLPLRLLIPVFAFFTALLLSKLPWDRLQELYLLHPTFAWSEEKRVDIRLSGMHWPRVGIAMVEYEKGAYVQVRLGDKEVGEEKEGKEGKEVVLTVPGSWELQEVRGAQARDVRTKDLGHGTRELAIPLNEQLKIPAGRPPDRSRAGSPEGEGWKNEELRLLFKTREQFDALRFAHDSNFPALLQISSATFPEREIHRATHFVKSVRMVEL